MRPAVLAPPPAGGDPGSGILDKQKKEKRMGELIAAALDLGVLKTKLCSEL